MGDRNFLEIPGSEPSTVSSCSSSPSSSSSCFSSVLSEKSLELCTESLGNETGCREIAETNLVSSVPSTVGSAPRGFVANKKAAPGTYPPPLTLIRGSESIHFQPHREDGRLIIEAFRAPTALGSLQAERSHGQLRVGFLEEPDLAADAEPFECLERAQEEEVEGDCLCREEEEEEEEVEMEEQDEDADCSGGGVNEKNEKFGVEMGDAVKMRARKDCWMGHLSWWLPLLELLPANFPFYHSMRFI